MLMCFRGKNGGYNTVPVSSFTANECIMCICVTTFIIVAFFATFLFFTVKQKTFRNRYRKGKNDITSHHIA